MRIYVASSWRNERQPEVVARLRAEGHEVYDFRAPDADQPEGTPGGFHWSKIDPDWKTWDATTFRAHVLGAPLAEHGFMRDFGAMAWADVCVMVQPCGRSAALELGWCAGAGKETIALLAEGQEPELMLKMADHLCLSLDEVVDVLARAPEVYVGTSSPVSVAHVYMCQGCGNPVPVKRVWCGAPCKDPAP